MMHTWLLTGVQHVSLMIADWLHSWSPGRIIRCAQVCAYVPTALCAALPCRQDAALQLLRDLPHLTLINAHGTNISNLALLQPLKGLQHLKLSQCEHITDDSLQHLRELTGLTHLDGNDIYILGPGLAGLTTLKELYLWDAPVFNPSGLSALATLTGLEVLNLNGTLTGVTPAGAAHAADEAHLPRADAARAVWRSSGAAGPAPPGLPGRAQDRRRHVQQQRQQRWQQQQHQDARAGVAWGR